MKRRTSPKMLTAFERGEQGIAALSSQPTHPAIPWFRGSLFFPPTGEYPESVSVLLALLNTVLRFVRHRDLRYLIPRLDEALTWLRNDPQATVEALNERFRSIQVPERGRTPDMSDRGAIFTVLYEELVDCIRTCPDVRSLRHRAAELFDEWEWCISIWFAYQGCAEWWRVFGWDKRPELLLVRAPEAVERAVKDSEGRKLEPLNRPAALADSILGHLFHLSPEQIGEYRVTPTPKLTYLQDFRRAWRQTPPQ